MAKKVNKKESKEERQFNFPDPLRKLIYRKYLFYCKQMSRPGPIKAWGRTTKRCNIDRQPHSHQLYEVGDSGYIIQNTPQNSHRSFDGSKSSFYPQWSIGLPLKSLTMPFLLNRSRSFFPTYLAITGVPCPAFMIGEVHHREYRWSRHDCTIVDPYGSDNEFIQFTKYIEFQDKLYALSLQGTLGVEYTNEQLTVTRTSKCRAVPSVRAKYFKEHMFESNGEILLVFLVYQKSLSLVDKVEIFRLEFSALEWIKVDKLGGRAVFLENKDSIWINSAEVGCRGDCVYFTLDQGDKWWIYDMGSDCLSVAWITQPDWAHPI